MQLVHCRELHYKQHKLLACGLYIYVVCVDLFVGTAVIINRGDMGSYGTVFKTVPETTKDFANRMTCFKIPGAKEAPVDAQGILPNLTLYTVCAVIF